MGFSIDFMDACVYFACPTCKGSGITSPPSTCHLGGFVDPDYCHDCGGNADVGVYIGDWLRNLAVGAALCRAWQQGLRDGVNMTSGYTSCGDGGTYCSDECEQAKECIL